MDKELKGEFVLKNKEKQSPPPALMSQAISKPENVPGSRIRFFSSYSHFPENAYFEDQGENEKIILIVRRDFITNFPWIFLSIILLIIPFTLMPFIIHFFPFNLPSQQLQFIFFAFYFLIVFGIVLLNFTLWYFQVGIISNERILDVNINGILYREVAEIRNEDIQDVSYTQSGFLTSLFNYGNVLVQTAGSKQNVELDRVPRPSLVARIIGELMEEK